MNDVEIFNETNEEIKEILEIEKVIHFALKKLDITGTEFDIIFVDNKKIHEINKTWRNVDRETDVISFALEDNKDMPKIGSRILGDIYISLDKAKSQALEYGHSLKRELCFLSIHGLLHLLGYDHQTKEEENVMFSLQKEILDSYGIKREVSKEQKNNS